MAKAIERKDEISTYYEQAKLFDLVSLIIFIISTVLSISIPFLLENSFKYIDILQTIFAIFIVCYFFINVFLKYYLIPKAEYKRRQQLLSNAYDTALTHEKTENYYNNNYTPGPLRLGANTLENAFFSKSVSKVMLINKSIFSIILLIIWLSVIVSRYSDFELILQLSQLLFGSGIIVSWFNLAMLNYNFEKVHDHLYQHFLQNIGVQSPQSEASILNEFSAYESAKANAGILLSSKIFFKMNEELTIKWGDIRKELKMDDE